MRCEITLYHCPEEEATIRRLGLQANAQQAGNEGFSKTIQPWKDICTHTYHYVARDSNTGIICGWLTASLKTVKRQTFMYLAEISTRRIRNELYGGVGQRLHTAFLADARRLGAKFACLYPLNAEVKAIYMKPEWGYVQLRPNVEKLFHILTGLPSKEFLDSMARPDPIELAKGIARRDTALRKQIDLVTPLVRSNPDWMKQLEEIIEIMEGNELPIAEQRAELWTFFQGVRT